MGVIVPAILPTSKRDLEEKLARLKGFTPSVQIDVVDGKFAAPATWPYGEDKARFDADADAGKLLSFAGDFTIDMDLMVSDAEALAGAFISMGASRITLHAESSNFLAQTLSALETTYGHDKVFAPDLFSVGIALNTTTELALIEPYFASIDYVQFMGIRTIGRQGEPFDASVLGRVKTFSKRYPDMIIQIDGGVSRANAQALLEAGANRLVVGSALWRAPDVVEELHFLNSLTEQYGLYD